MVYSVHESTEQDDDFGRTWRRALTLFRLPPPHHQQLSKTHISRLFWAADTHRIRVNCAASMLASTRRLAAAKRIHQPICLSFASSSVRLASSQPGQDHGEVDMTAAADGIQDPNAYCRNLVQKRDYEAFLTSYFYPRHLQPGYLALRAFYVCDPLVPQLQCLSC